jgi:Winged helix DNA-binding domain
MNLSELINRRLVNQQIAATEFKKPQDVVAWMGAMQAQDFGMAKWAIGLRIPRLKDADVEKAFNEGEFLRTHVLRPTWHFVMPEDIRWMLALTAPHIIRLLAYNDRMAGLSKKILTKANDVLAKALQGGNQFTRDELRSALQKEKIVVNDLGFTHVMIHAELDGIACSGPRRGKQFTYALLDERVPNTKTLSHEEALAALTKRYFTSHGPAALQDFAWWSGLSMTNVRKGIDTVMRDFKKEIIDGKEYFFKPMSVKEVQGQTVYLLPNYDEYTVAYKDRAILFDKNHSPVVTTRGNAIFNNTILINGKVEGTWKRTIKNKSVVIETKPFRPFNKTKQRAVTKVAKQYSEFVSKEIVRSI